MEYNEREACGLSDHLIADKYYDFYGDAELLCTGEGERVGNSMKIIFIPSAGTKYCILEA